MDIITNNTTSECKNLNKDELQEVVSDLNNKNEQLERLVNDMALIATANNNDKLLEFVVDKTLSLLSLQTFAILFDKNKISDKDQYYFCNSSKTPNPFNDDILISLKNYFDAGVANAHNVINISEISDKLDSDTLTKLQNENIFLILPLFGQDDFLGVVLFGKKSTGNPFTNSEIFYTEHLYAILSLALQNKINYHTSITDGKTGLYTYSYFVARIDEKLNEVKNRGGSHSLLMLDVDKFKEFNDNFGHLAGDEALALLAKVLLQSVRNDDLVCRFGGEEFLIFLSDIHPSCLFTVAERIRKNIEKAAIVYKIDGAEKLLHITVSIGGTVIDSSNDMDSTRLLQFVDSALYRSKTNGRNCTTII